MRSGKNTDIKVGITVLVGIAILIFGIGWGKRLIHGGGDVLYARFDKAGGAERGDPVFIRGLKRGTIDNVDVNQKGEIIAAMTLDTSQMPLYKDATAKIMMLELMGGHKIEIAPGLQTDSAFNITKDTINGSTPGDISAMVAMITSLEGKINSLAGRADSVLGLMQDFLGDPRFKDGILSAIDEARSTLKDVSATMKDARAMLVENRESLRNAIKQAETLATKLNGTLDELRPDIKATLDDAHKLIGKADAMITEINKMLTDSKTNNSLLHMLTSDKEFSKRLDSTLRSAAKLIEQLRLQGIDANIRFFHSTTPEK